MRISMNMCMYYACPFCDAEVFINSNEVYIEDKSFYDICEVCNRKFGYVTLPDTDDSSSFARYRLFKVENEQSLF
jgi:hypothetical protein